MWHCCHVVPNNSPLRGSFTFNEHEVDSNTSQFALWNNNAHSADKVRFSHHTIGTTATHHSAGSFVFNEQNNPEHQSEHQARTDV
jgi:hypothetical protein